MNTLSNLIPPVVPVVNFHIDIEPRQLDVNKVKLKILTKNYIDPENDDKEIIRLELTKYILEALEKPSAKVSPTSHHIDPPAISNLVNETIVALDEFKDNLFFKGGTFLMEMDLHRKIGETKMTTATFILGPGTMMVYVCSSFHSFVDVIIEKRKCSPQLDSFDLSI